MIGRNFRCLLELLRHDAEHLTRNLRSVRHGCDGLEIAHQTHRDKPGGHRTVSRIQIRADRGGDDAGTRW